VLRSTQHEIGIGSIIWCAYTLSATIQQEYILDLEAIAFSELSWSAAPIFGLEVHRSGENRTKVENLSKNIVRSVFFNKTVPSIVEAIYILWLHPKFQLQTQLIVVRFS
jgi:hypothetical protein